MTENDRGGKDNGTIALLLVDGSGAMYEHAVRK